MSADAPFIRTIAKPHCLLCGSMGNPLYHSLTDFQFHAPGSWSLSKCPAADCGLIWLDPFPLLEDIPLAYQSYYTHTDGQCRPSFQSKLRNHLYAAYQSLQRLPASVAGLQPDKDHLRFMFLADLPPGNVLDAGCGDGGFLHRMRQRGWSVDGFDFDQSALENAQKQYGLTLRHGDIKTLSFPAGSFDAITLNHVIEHVPDPLEMFAECKRLLKTGGRLVMATPNTGSLGHEEFKNYWRGLEPPRHLFLFSPVTLRKCAEKTGLRTIIARSTAANADVIGGASFSIREAAGHRVQSQPAVNFGRTLKAMSFQYREHRRIGAGFDCGEEAILVCEKVN